MENENAISGQFIIFVILHNHASCIVKEGTSVETVIQAISKFRTEMEMMINKCQPIWSKVDLADARIIWDTKSSAAKRARSALQRLEHLRERTNNWLLAEGFSELKISVGIETGLIILNDHGILGVPITTAHMLADYGLDKNSVVISESMVPFLNLNFNRPLRLIDLEVEGLSNKQRKVAVIPLSEFS